MNQDPSADLEPLYTDAAGRENLAGLLAETQALGDLPWGEISALAGYMQGYRLAAGRVLFREGEPGDYWCMILAGRVAILKADSHDTPKEVARLGPGKSLGEMAMLDGERRSATCVAQRETLLAVMTRQGFEALVEAYPRLAVALLIRVARILSQRLRQASGRLVEHLTPPA